MPHCSKCGGLVADGAGFCPSCGAPQAAGAGAAPASVSYVPPVQAGDTGLAENVAGLLCYVLGWVTGLVFFLIDKRPFVRFHAAQAMVVFGGLTILSVALSMFTAVGIFGGAFHIFFLLFGLIHFVLWLVFLILWVLCMVKAYQHELFRVPIAASIADSLVKQ
jgi:uncharacterized membrane protein